MTPEIDPTENDAARRLERQRQADLDAQERMYQRAIAEQQEAVAANVERAASEPSVPRARPMYGAGDVKVTGAVVSNRSYGSPQTYGNFWVVENGTLQNEALSQPTASGQ